MENANTWFKEFFLIKNIAEPFSYQYDMFWHSARLVLRYKIFDYEHIGFYCKI